MSTHDFIPYLFESDDSVNSNNEMKVNSLLSKYVELIYSYSHHVF